MSAVTGATGALQRCPCPQGAHPACGRAALAATIVPTDHLDSGRAQAGPATTYPHHCLSRQCHRSPHVLAQCQTPKQLGIKGRRRAIEHRQPHPQHALNPYSVQHGRHTAERFGAFGRTSTAAGRQDY